jgi:hypothetical protein
MQRYRPKPVRSRSILHRRIRRETEEDDSVWDDAILILGGDDKPAASESGS